MFPSILLVISYYLANIKPRLIKSAIPLGLVVISLVSLINFPVYSAYYSPVFGGARTALNMGIYDNSGEYFADSARYLNSKDRDINVYVPNNVASFYLYFKGQLVEDPNIADYIVVSLDQDRTLPNNYGCPNLEASFGSIEQKVVYIFKCKE